MSGTPTLAEAIAKVLTEHHVTRGMQVASGVTCECGYWTGSEPEAGKRPLPWGRDRLDLHRGQVLAEFMQGALAAAWHAGVEESGDAIWAFDAVKNNPFHPGGLPPE